MIKVGVLLFAFCLIALIQDQSMVSASLKKNPKKRATREKSMNEKISETEIEKIG